MQLSLKPFDLVMNRWCKLDLRERETTNEIKRKPAQTATAELLPNKSHATANISFELFMGFTADILRTNTGVTNNGFILHLH